MIRVQTPWEEALSLHLARVCVEVYEMPVCARVYSMAALGTPAIVVIDATACAKCSPPDHICAACANTFLEILAPCMAN